MMSWLKRRTPQEKKARLDEITDHAGMKNKGWTFSGDDKDELSVSGDKVDNIDKTLGILWIPRTDEIKF